MCQLTTNALDYTFLQKYDMYMSLVCHASITKWFISTERRSENYV